MFLLFACAPAVPPKDGASDDSPAETAEETARWSDVRALEDADTFIYHDHECALGIAAASFARSGVTGLAVSATERCTWPDDGSRPPHTEQDVRTLEDLTPLYVNASTAGTLLPEVPGMSIDAAGDVDGDGAIDLVLAGPDDGWNFVVVQPLLGRASPGEAQWIASELEHTTDISAVGAGDADGDGLADLLVAAPYAPGPDGQSGAVWLVPGPVLAVDRLESAGLQITATVDDGFFGAALATAGDTDGDGRPEALVGASSAAGTSGTVWIVQQAEFAAGALDGDGIRLSGSAYADGVGRSVVGGSDLDGDGYDDIIVGAPGVSEAGEFSGAVFVVHGPVSSGNIRSVAAATFLGAERGERLGQHVEVAGDADGDGAADLLLSAHDDDNQPVYLLFGPFAGEVEVTDAPGVRIDCGESGNQGGDVLKGLGDIDGDGRDDFLIGAPSASTEWPDGVSSTGFLAVFRGRARE
jgi:hypothetical protein